MEESKLLESLRTHPGMWMPQPTYATLVALLIGYDTATGGGFLGGFDEFIELRYRSTSSLHWSSLALMLSPDEENELSDAQKREKLLDLIEEFLAIGRGRWRQRMLFREWLTMTDPDPALLRYSRSPPPETVSIDEAERLLGLSRREVFKLIRDGELRAGLEGAEVRIVREQLDAHLATP